MSHMMVPGYIMDPLHPVVEVGTSMVVIVVIFHASQDEPAVLSELVAIQTLGQGWGGAPRIPIGQSARRNSFPQ